MTAPASAVALAEMRWWDIEPVLGLEAELFPEDAWTSGMFWSELAHARGPHASRRYLVARTADAPTRPGSPSALPHRGLVGYGGVAVVAGTADIQTIGVLPEWRGGGWGAALLAALLSAASELEAREVLLEVRVDNTPAQRLYARFGFEPIGVRRGYYQPGNVDALVMRLDDPDSRPHGFWAETARRGSPTGSAPTAPETDRTTQGTGNHG